jgi:hypothetical protein
LVLALGTAPPRLNVALQLQTEGAPLKVVQ